MSLRWVDFNMPSFCQNLPDIDMITSDPFEHESIANDMIASLNVQQKAAFDDIVEAVNDTSMTPKCRFLDGPGGSGKTYLYTTLIHYFKGKNEIVLSAASTGIAANLLIGGRTYHSLFKLPIPITETTTSSIKCNSQDAETLRKCKLIIIDESTMASCHALNAIDRLLKDVMSMDREKGVPFGGKVILLGGDFRQCLAIVPHAMRPAIVENTLQQSKNWKHFKKLSLISNMRSVDPDYSEWLLKLGNGTLTNPHGLDKDLIEIPPDLVSKGNLIEEIFGDNIQENMIESISKRAILCPKNVDVDKINNEIISKIEGDSRTYLSYDQVVTDDEEVRNNFQTEFLNTLSLSGLPSHKLTLKKGTVVMLLRNLNTKRGLCNGTRLIVRDMTNHIIKCDILTESGIGETVLIPRIDCTNKTEMPFELKRRQFPLKPAFAMTINKAQGQTLEKVGIFLSAPVFGHGQLYVAFSRVRRSCDVKVKIIDTSDQGKLIEGSDSVFTKNVVYTEVLEEKDMNDIVWDEMDIDFDVDNLM